VLKRFQFEDQMDRIEAEVGAGDFNERRPPDVSADELMGGDDAVSGDLVDLGDGHGTHFSLTVTRWTGLLFQRQARMQFPIHAASAIILRELANCLYEAGNYFAGAGERAPVANPGMAEAPAEAFPAAGGWRPCRGRRMRGADRGKTRREPADGQRAHEDPATSRPREGQAHQTVDVLQARRSEHKKSKADDRGTGIGGKYFRTKRAASVGAGSTGKNEPRDLSTVKPEKNKLPK
jgi:hypothetical protein